MTFAEAFEDVRQALEYPLLKLGGSTITLASIVELFVLVALVLLGERLFRR